MEIRNLITFTKVAEAQSLSKAAKLLGYVQSTVTMQMQQLEQELGVPLYERVGKQIRITQAGQELLTYAVPIIKMSQDALCVGRGSSREIGGSLRLGVAEASDGEVFADRVNAYMTAHPDVELEIRTEHDNSVLLNLLRHNEIDILLLLDYRRDDPDLVIAEEAPEFIHFFAAPSHPLADKKNVDLLDILRYPLIRGSEELSYVKELQRMIFRENARQIVVRDQNLAFRIAAGERGKKRSENIILAPDAAAKGCLMEKKLVQLDYSFPECRMRQQTIYHKNKWLTGAMNAWISMSEDEG